MNVRNIEAVVETIKSYTSLDTKEFAIVCKFFLEYYKREYFDLKTQNGLKTLKNFRATL